MGEGGDTKWWLLGAALLLPVPLIMVMSLALPLLMGAAEQEPQCVSVPAVAVDPATVPNGPIADYSGVQLVNAAHIMVAAQRLGLTLRDQEIGVMTAMGESTLRVLDYGDAAGPDSRGLFQQRDNGAWGSYEDRMQPFISATNFFKALMKVSGRENMEPTLAAHEAQHNSDPYHYRPFWPAAQEVVLALAGVKALPGAPSIDPRCLEGVERGVVAKSGWALPAKGEWTSPFGPRLDPVSGKSSFHTGLDIAPRCDAPIFAATSGRVVGAERAGGYGNLITIDAENGGLVTRYAHMFDEGVLVHVGDRVTAGQQIAKVGTFGNSTGCHLHFEVRIDDHFVDPGKVLEQVGVAKG